jgi:hypothetical protein
MPASGCAASPLPTSHTGPIATTADALATFANAGPVVSTSGTRLTTTLAADARLLVSRRTWPSAADVNGSAAGSCAPPGAASGAAVIAAAWLAPATGAGFSPTTADDPAVPWALLRRTRVPADFEPEESAGEPPNGECARVAAGCPGDRAAPFAGDELKPPVDPPEPVVSANATAGIQAATAAPMPNATASAPTRPT